MSAIPPLLIHKQKRGERTKNDALTLRVLY